METGIEPYLTDIETRLVQLEKDDVVARIWRKDHTVWKPDPTEITNRLGWLTITDFIREQLPFLESFADDDIQEPQREDRVGSGPQLEVYASTCHGDPFGIDHHDMLQGAVIHGLVYLPPQGDP